jgi:hypothetical protein
VSKLAVGNMLASASTVSYRAPQDLSQSAHIEGLPLGTTGGMLVKHNFPLDAEYVIKIRARGGPGGIGAPGGPEQDVEVTIDGVRVKLARSNTIELKLPVKAGPRTIGVSLVRHSPSGADEIWDNPIPGSSVQSVAITGPLNPTQPGDTPSRRRVFTCHPAAAAEEAACARKIISALATRAYRQDVSGSDLDTLLKFYAQGRSAGAFDDGIEQALERVLVDPRSGRRTA